MAYPFKTHQFNIPSEKTEIYSPTRQELIFSATICNQGSEDAKVSLWTKISGIESPVEFERTVPGTNTAGNKAIAVALESIVLQSGDAILVSGGSLSVSPSPSSWGEVLDSNWSSSLDSGWADALDGTGSGGSSGSGSNTNNQTLTISILY